MTPRSLAYDLLGRSEKSKQYSNIALDHALEKSGLSHADKRLASALFYGVTERRITLDYRISQLSARPVSELDAEVLCALRIGLYQLMYLDRIPAHAAINETVGLCKKRFSGFVNAILRAHTREPFVLPSREDAAEYLSVSCSVCKELCEKFISIFGVDEAERVLNGFFGVSDTTLRVNTLRTSRDALAQKFEDATPTDISPAGLYVRGSVRELYGFSEGLFFVQDQASQICVEALDAREGELMLDICACPGSKSFGSAIKMNGKGRIIAFDLHENKLSLVKESAKRLGIDIIETSAMDGRTPIPELFGKADRVLCDVPCSGFGVLGKKPELRYKSPEESARLPEIQRAILDNASRYVKVGGTLVYSTCTLLPEENQQNIQEFLSRHPEFSLAPWSVGSLEVSSGMITLLPHIHNTDGFFIAKLIRK